MQTLPPLPIGSQDFEGIVKGNYIYVDKTKYLYALLQPGIQKGASGPKYFFSRPRRFGKSLTLSTLDAIFSGKKELFKGLFISEQTDYDFQTFPVLRFDFSKLENSSGPALQTSLIRQITHYCDCYGVATEQRAPLRDVWETFMQFFKSKNQKIIILIDEYDKPILDHITTLPIAKENRDVLKGFYEIIKANDETIRFLFITGITKFSQMNIFSGLNNLRDISLDPRYAAICGYTQEELESCFAQHMAYFAQVETQNIGDLREKIRHWYNGFRFTKDPITVYNPFSTLMLFETMIFQYHWFSTGTPTYLMHLIREHALDIESLHKASLSIHDTASYHIENLTVNFSALLFQTGYLTIQHYDTKYEVLELGYPNLEVKEAFNQELLKYASYQADTSTITVIDLRRALDNGNIPEMFRILKVFFSKIPYDIQEATEKYYQSLFHLIFTVIGTRIRSEVRTNTGRIDAIVETATHLYLFEFKLNGSAQEALDQIDTKDYPFSFQDSGKIIQKMGVCFSMLNRNIDEWRGSPHISNPLSPETPRPLGAIPC